ncbi:AbgT family transporter, partial [Clostridium tertium]
VSSTDALLLPFTQAAAETGDAMAKTQLAGTLSVTSNWFFMIASTFVIIILGTIVVDKFVEPRLGSYNKKDAEIEADHEITQQEKNAYKFTNKIMLIVVALIVLAALPIDKNNVIPVVGDLSTTVALVSLVDGAMASSAADGFLNSIFFKGDMVIMLMFVIFAASGLLYGFKSGKFKKAADIV